MACLLIDINTLMKFQLEILYGILDIALKSSLNRPSLLFKKEKGYGS